MRRPHRSIETFDISLMAVVTKAMGAFLVLMLLLLPYYTPNARTQEVTEELLLQLKVISSKIHEASRQLGPPGNASQGPHGPLQAAAAQVKLTADVVAKLEGLLNKAFTDIDRLQRDNQSLGNENRSLTEQNRTAREEIAELRSETQQLKDKLNDPDRSVIVSVNAVNCNDIDLEGVILPVKDDLGYTWTKDKAPIKREHLLYGWYGAAGGVISWNVPSRPAPFTDRGPLRNFSKVSNSILLANQNVGHGEYAVILMKKDHRRTWRFRDSDFRILTPSANDCTITYTPAAKIGKSWNSDIVRSAVLDASAPAAIILSLTSDQNGVSFRAPRDIESKWFDNILQASIGAQAADAERGTKMK